MYIATILDMAAEAFGDRTAIVAGARRLSYAELRAAAQAAAARFRTSGAEAVALLDVTTPAVPIALYGAAYAGIPYVPLNYRLTAPEVNGLLARLGRTVLIVGADYRGLVEPREGLTIVLRAELLAWPPSSETIAPGDDPRAIAVQLFTSGTTGKPKAAVLRHENLMSYVVGTLEFASAAEDEAGILSVPPYHIAGISAALSSTYVGRRSVQLESFDARSWVAACRRERVTYAFLVPTMLSRIMDLLIESGEPADLPSLRAIAYGGGKMPLTTIQRAMRLLPHVDFTNAYGLTETSSTITVLGPEDHRAAWTSADPKVQKRLASVGRATGAVEVEIRDEQGRRLGPNETGLVYVRGGQVSGEYLTLGSALDAEGWFSTRDRGTLDEDGYLFLDGRADDVIVRGGENISPGEIEDVLTAHPAVADAAVVAVPDEHWGEGVGAAVVLRAGASVTPAELQDLVKSRLRSSRVPQTIVFREALPYNELGKVLRRVIREELAVGHSRAA